MNWKKFLAKVRASLFPNAVKPPAPPVVVTPPPSPVVEPVPPVVVVPDNGDALDISQARTISKYVRNVPAMPVTVRLFDVNTTPDRVTMNYTATGWPSDGTIDGRIAIIFREGDELIIGEFDGKRPNQKMKGLENIHGGYIQGKQPAAGAPVWYVIYDKRGTARSNVAAGGTWKTPPPRADGSGPSINTELLRP